jgi:hypothetical protein
MNEDQKPRKWNQRRIDDLPADEDPQSNALVGVGVWTLKKLESAPMPVAGTWESAKRWTEMARHAAKVTVYCQVMVGFELLALREAHGETRGRKGRNNPKDLDYSGDPEPFYDRVRREIGVSDQTALNWMRMAEAAVPQLKKLGALKGVDPTTTPLGSLTLVQQTALDKALHKLTDGRTQSDFLQELGLAKMPQGSGATGGARPHPAKEVMDPVEQHRIMAELARKQGMELLECLYLYGAKFMLLDDTEVRTQMDWLDDHLKARRAWLSKPAIERDAAHTSAAEKLLRDL